MTEIKKGIDFIMNDRLYKFDNLKTVLISLVVFGHFLELVEGHRLLYLTIYSFHMPLFLFITGYFAHFNKKKIWSKMICPYVIFQILYTCFERYVLGAEGLTLTFVRPRWLLWYLFSMIVYYLLIPLFDTVCVRKQCIIIVSMVIAALLSGYDNRLGYDFSAARIVTFMPFFFSGYYLSKNRTLLLRAQSRLKTAYAAGFFCAVVLIAGVIQVLDMGFVSSKILYGSYSYEAAGYNWEIKLLLYAFAGIWIAVGVMFMPDKKVPVLSTVGRYTMPIFLLHGFVVKLADAYCDKIGKKLPFILAVIFSVLVVFLFGNRFVNDIFNHVFTGRCMERRASLWRRKD